MNSPRDDDNYASQLKLVKNRNALQSGRWVRWIIGCIFMLCLFVFLHFREVRIEMLELNSIVERNMVAQVDFDFFDKEATDMLKQEAARDVDRIYRINEKEVRQRRLEFEEYLIHNQGWRKVVKYSTFEEMYKAVDALEETLLETRLTDARTIQKMKEMHLPVLNYQEFLPEEIDQQVNFPEGIWKHIVKMAFVDHVFHKQTKSFIVHYFMKKGWDLEQDIFAERLVRRLVQAQIPDRFTKVNAGDRIIDQGERVTARHLTMFKSMKQALSDVRNLWHPLTLVGSMILTILFTSIGYVYFKVNFPTVIYSNKKLALLVSVVILTLALSKVTEYLLLKNPHNLIEVVRYPIFAPFAAILLCILMSPRIAVFISGFLSVVLSITLAVERNGFVIVNLLTSFVVVLSAGRLHKRKEVFVVCAKAWTVCVLVVLALNFYDNTLWSLSIVTDITSSLVSMCLTAILVVGFLPLLESTFSILTDVILMEYLDPNHELLRCLSIEAPGTYQHSIVVGNLAERAALAIGANGLFCRVATMYHDIGKLITPHYFTENQQGGINMHHLLTPLESSQVIVGHVMHGIEIAYKFRLPEPFIDIIREHHGGTLVYYFYCKQAELVGGDRSLVDEEDFRYPGPCPQSRESAVIMIADSLEAASRSLDELSESAVTELVETIVNEKAEAGQFDHCQLTFEELSIVKTEMIKTLVAAGHSRIKYPKKER